MKKTDVNFEVRPFFETFVQFSRRFDYARSYSDFLSMALTQFVYPDCPIGQKMHSDAVSPYNDSEKKLMGVLFTQMLLTYRDRIRDDTSWYDFFGDFYMELSSNSKSKAFGQFFTPSEICDLMTLLTESQGVTGATVNDPACGSGRLALSHHVRNLGNYYVCEDIDPVCCKMAVLNFLLHGVKGEIIEHDSLMNPDTYVRRYVVNPHISGHIPFPHVEIYENGRIKRSFASELAELTQPITGASPAAKTIVLKHAQLSLF